VQLAGRFGELEYRNGRLLSFSEKPATTEARINGGFMVFENERVWSYLNDDPGLVFETDVLVPMTNDGALGIHEHDGYWQCMDTPREHALLNAAWDEGNAPWKTW
jgi:glucose-1-phosphate cytidylyltransferase